MRLQRLKLRNFQGIAELDLEFGGQDAVIYGDNATGKTTVFNAVTWLLTGGASTGAAGYTPKTRTADGDAHNLSHIAEAVFTCEDGGELTLCKDYHEVYKKKKGARTAEFSGHTTDYFVNGVPAKEKEYAARIADICDAKWLKILTMPQYLPEIMSWDERRRILVEVCGDTDDKEIIAGIDGFAQILGNRTPDEFKKIAAAQKTAINKELDGIPGRIDEASKAVVPVPADLDNSIEKQTARINALQAEYDEALSGIYAKSGLQKELSAANAELERVRGEHERMIVRRMNEHKTELEMLQTAVLRAERKEGNLRRDKREKEEELESLLNERKRLVDEYADIAALRFDTSSTVCPTCGREYPREKVAEMVAKFNTDKSERLTRLNERGRRTASKEMIARTRDEIEKLAAEIEIAARDATICREKHNGLIAAAGTLEPVETNEEYKRSAARVKELEERMSGARAEENDYRREFGEKLERERQRLGELKELKGSRVSSERALKRIEELKEREKELAASYEDAERALYLCDEFVRAKVAALTDKINGRFENVRFELFATQVNGGVKECCEVLVPSPDGRLVPYAYANNAARINAGLEIISELSRCAGVSLPVFIDNAESVTRLVHTDLQTIRLVVSEADKELRLEGVITNG